MASPATETTTSTANRSIQLAIDSTVGETTTNASHTSPSNQSKTIDQQLADTAAAQQKRRQEMSSSTASTMMRKVVHAVTTDHNTARLTLICLSLVCSFFGSLLLVIAGADPPYQNGPLYQYDDLMRLMTSIHDKTIEITPNLSKKTWEEELKNGTLNGLIETSTSRFTNFIQDWWPIKKIDFASNDAILNDINFYSRNYKTFQMTFIVMMTFGDLILLCSWMYFLAAKELQIYRHRKHQNGYSQNGRIKSPVELSERASKLWEKVKRFLSGKSLKKLKRSWVDDAPRRPWQRPVIVIVCSIVTTNVILFIILMFRPNMFALILHQVVFVLLAIVCLASTEVHEPKVPKLPVVKEVPRSLRASNGSDKSKQSNGSNSRVHHQSPDLIAAPVVEKAVRETPKPQPIFITEESKASTSAGYTQTQPRGSNPFGDEDEESGDEYNHPNSPTKRHSIDEEVEKEVERV